MTARGSDPSQARSLPEQITQSLFHHFAADLGNGAGQRNVLWANLHTILGIAAFMDTAVAHQSRQSLALQRLPGGMRIEKPYLGNGSGAYETGTVVELGASLH